MTAREIGRVTIVEALELTALIARKAPRRHPRVAADPSWSPDGRQLTYASGGTLWRAEGDGTDPVALATFDGRDTIPEASAWSPDSRSVAFLTGHPEFGIYYARSNAVWRVNSDGRDLRQLTPWKLDVSSPTWSPDSRELAFSALPALESPSDIFVVPADAARPRNVTHDNSEEASPQWSRAGLLAYVAREYDVFTISPDGTRLGRAAAGEAGRSSSTDSARSVKSSFRTSQNRCQRLRW